MAYQCASGPKYKESAITGEQAQWVKSGQGKITKNQVELTTNRSARRLLPTQIKPFVFLPQLVGEHTVFFALILTHLGAANHHVMNFIRPVSNPQ